MQAKNIYVELTLQNWMFIIYIMQAKNIYVELTLQNALHILISTEMYKLIVRIIFYPCEIYNVLWTIYHFVPTYTGRVDDLSFFEYLSPFCFL